MERGVSLPDEAGLEPVKSSAGTKLGSAHGDDKLASLEQLLVRQHKELMRRIMWQEHLLARLSRGENASPGASPVRAMQSSFESQYSHSWQPERFSSPRSRRVSRRVKEHLHAAEDSRNSSSTRLFQSYSAFDLALRAEAEEVHKERTSNLPSPSSPASEISEAPEGAPVRDQSRRSTRPQLTGAKWIVAHPLFDVFFAVVVFANSLFLGLEVESYMSGYWLAKSTIQATNYFFAILFTSELLLRLTAEKLEFLWSDDWVWNWLDIVIVGSSLVEIAFDVAAAASSGERLDDDLNSITGFKVFRVIRLSRIVKTLRLVRVVRFVIALRTLVSSIVHTFKALFWALTLLSLIIYVFAVLFAQGVYEHGVDPSAQPLSSEDQRALDTYFKSLPMTMLSLFMTITGGVSWEDIIRPLMGVHFMWVACFLFYVAFTIFAVLNVVTGVFCQSAIENAQKDHAAVVASILEHKDNHLKKIRMLFSQLDAEDEGVITYEMLRDKCKSKEVSEYFESLGLNISDAWNFFKLLDVDRGGAVEVEEFLLGCLRLRGQARAIDMAKLMYDHNWLVKNQGKFQLFVEEEMRQLRGEVRALALTR